MELKIIETVDNSNVAPKINETKRQFEELQKQLEHMDFKSLSAPQISNLSEQIHKEVKRIISSINEYKVKLEELKATRKSLEDSGKYHAAGDLNNQINAIESSIRAREKEFRILDEYSNKLAKAEENLGKLKKKEESSVPIMQQLLGGTENYNKILSKLPPGFKAAVQGLNGMTGAAKAFIATPLGAVVAALILSFQTLKQYLTGTADGQERLAVISGYYQGIVSTLKGEVSNLGREFSNLFGGIENVTKAFQRFINMIIGSGKTVWNFHKIFTDLPGALIAGIKNKNFDGVKKLFTDFGDSVKQAFTGEATTEFTQKLEKNAEAMAALNKRSNQLAMDRAKWQEREAELDREIASARTAMFAGSDAEKAAAAARVQALNNEKYGQLIKFAQEEYDIRKAINDLDRDNVSQEALKEEYRLKGEITRLDAQRISANSRGSRVSANMHNKELQAEYQYQNELNEILQQNLEKRLALMDDGSKKELAQIEASYQKQLGAVRKLRAKWVLESTKQGRGGALTTEQESALYTAEALAKQARDKAVYDYYDDTRREYMKQYGTLKERELAITEEYQKKLEATEKEDFERRKIIYRQYVDEMEKLHKKV